MNLRIPALTLSDDMQRRLGRTVINRRRYDSAANKAGLNLAKRVESLLSVKKTVKKSRDDE